MDSLDDNFDGGDSADIAGSNDDEDDDNNHLEFAVDGSIVISKTACMENCILENLLKLRTNVVKTVVEWCSEMSCIVIIWLDWRNFITCQKMLWIEQQVRNCQSGSS